MSRARDLADSADKDIAGTLTVDAVTSSGDITLADNAKAIFGAGSDLQIYHDGTHSYIKDAGTGDIRILADNNVVIGDSAYTENKAVFQTNGPVILSYDGATKFSTTSYGVDISGSVVADTQTASVTGSQTPDFNTYQNFLWTLTGNITLVNPTTEKQGQTGFFIFIHSGGARTVSLQGQYATAGGAGLTLSGAAGAVDIVPYVVRQAGFVYLGTPQLAFA